MMDSMVAKEEAYYDAFRAGRTAKNIWKYVPAKLLSCGAVTNAVADSDGYWVWLDFEEGGWRAYDHGSDCGVIHEYTIKDLREALKTIRQNDHWDS